MPLQTLNKKDDKEQEYDYQVQGYQLDQNEIRPGDSISQKDDPSQINNDEQQQMVAMVQKFKSDLDALKLQTS